MLLHRPLPYQFNIMGRSPCCVKEGLKKGPWTQEEDEKLIAFVKEHGHGNWRALPKKCGLLRCGKSCRLRWNNYLRPDIKRGMFSQSEEQKIFQLHALVGNKWAFIASQLPKRTDNEIKNYWNTVLKKRLQKERQNSLILSGALRTSSAAESRQRQDNQNNIKGSHDSASKKLSSNSCTVSSSVMSCAHLAQWESARLEAEARLAKESQSGRKAHTLLSFACNYMMHSFSSSNTTTTSTTAAPAANMSTLANHTHTNHRPLSQLSSCFTLPSSISNRSGLIHHMHPSTISPFSSASSLSLPSCRSSASYNSSPTCASSKSLSSLPSQESMASALTLGPNGRLSWQAKEISFTTSPSTSQSSLISQMLCQIKRDHNAQVVHELQASTKDGDLIKPGLGEEEQPLNLEASSSIIVDLNSTMESSMDLNCTMENWHDFIFDVENSCSDVVSTTNWRDAAMVSSPQREQFSHGASSLISNTTTSGTLAQGPQDQSSLDLEGLSFDSLISCEHYANQHSNVLMKELLWDTPTTLSISSTSIVN